MSLGRAVVVGSERIVAPVEGVHRSIAARWFNALGPSTRPVQLAHETISRLIYGSIRVGAAVVGVGLDAGTAISPHKADSIQAIANGLWGDALHEDDTLAISMSIRDSEGRPVTPGLDLAAASPSATGRLVILAHGLFETERSFLGNDAEPGLAEKTAAHAELTAVPIRYNSGLRVSENGAQLAALLESLYSSWPVPVRSIALVGHSMGGLVVRSACLAAADEGYDWIDDVKVVVTVGSPHQGSPLEKLANVVSWGLNVAPETRPLAAFLNGRSAGIKDLRFGSIAPTDWDDDHPDALLSNPIGDHSLPTGFDHHFIGGAVSADPNHPLGFAMGDLLVRVPSSTGGDRLIPTTSLVLGGLRHSDLLRQPAVTDQIMDWLAPSTV